MINGTFETELLGNSRCDSSELKGMLATNKVCVSHLVRWTKEVVSLLVWVLIVL
jgi:hypothetical protein